MIISLPWPPGRKPQAVFWEKVILAEWVPRETYQDTEVGAPTAWCLQQHSAPPATSSLTNEAAPWCVHLGEVTWLPAGLCSDIRLWLWHQFEDILSDSIPNISGHNKAFGLLQNGPGQRWCHVVLNGFSSWSTTRNKKVIFLEFSPQGVQTKLCFPGILSHARHKHIHPLTLCWVPILNPLEKLKFTEVPGSIGFTALLDPQIPAWFHPCNLKSREIKGPKALKWLSWNCTHMHGCPQVPCSLFSKRISFIYSLIQTQTWTWCVMMYPPSTSTSHRCPLHASFPPSFMSSVLFCFGLLCSASGNL